jgi:hypothetical protein
MAARRKSITPFAHRLEPTSRHFRHHWACQDLVVVPPSEALVEGAGRRTAVPYEPNDVRAHNLRVVSLRHGAEGMSSALMFRRHHAQRGITDVGVDVGDHIRRYYDGEMRT